MDSNSNIFLTCKNICDRIKKFSIARYKLGLKWCRLCEAAFDTTKRFCECCGRWLRTRSHTYRNRKENTKSGLDKLIRRREKNRKASKRYYQKHSKTPEFRLKYNEAIRRWYQKHHKLPEVRLKYNQRKREQYARARQRYYERLWITNNVIT